MLGQIKIKDKFKNLSVNEVMPVYAVHMLVSSYEFQVPFYINL